MPDGDDYAIEMLDLETGAKQLFKTGGTYWDPVWTANGKGLLIGVYAERDATLSRLRVRLVGQEEEAMDAG